MTHTDTTRPQPGITRKDILTCRVWQIRRTLSLAVVAAWVIILAGAALAAPVLLGLAFAGNHLVGALIGTLAGIALAVTLLRWLGFLD